MANLLIPSLREEEKILLAGLCMHPGFPVLVKLASEACVQANGEIVKVDPTNPQYAEILKSTQLMARAMNKFSADLFASCRWHANEGKVEQETQQLIEQLGK